MRILELGYIKCLYYKSYPSSSVTECATMAESLAELPPNILSEILSRLPIKSLFACRYVCKTFLDITSSNPYFNSLHSSKTSLNLIMQFGDACNHPTRYVHLVDSGLEIAFVFGEEVGLKLMFQIPNHPERYFKRYHLHAGEKNCFVLVNSCDGLLYFAERSVCERSFVCNPITNEYVTLLGLDEERSRLQLTMGMWFGFSRGENQYKVLRIFSTLTGRPWEMGYKHEIWAQIHVVGSSSWRDIKDQPISEYLTWDTCFTLLNGTVYWLCRYPELKKLIIFFDFQQEKFGEVLPPLEFGIGWQINQHRMSIGVLGGRLSVTVNTESLDIWVVEKDESRVFWTKQFVIDKSIFMGYHISEGPWRPLQILGSGQIVMMLLPLVLICYDPKEKTFQFIKSDRALTVGKAVLLRPSFVPLKDALMVDNVIVQKME